VVLGPDFFVRETLEVARDLLGKLLVREVGGCVLWGRLVEVEAYCGPEDRAAHSSRGLTPRTRVMYGPPGHAYVYVIYGMHHCLNLVTRPEGIPQAVLIRALEPGPGVGRCSGPGLVCRALRIDRSLNGARLCPPSLYVVDDGLRPDPELIVRTPRIGVEYAGEWASLPWRFCLDGPYLPYLSRPVRRRSAVAEAGERARRR
jgi:DNA-3-methyladenine glycosylase